MKQHGLQVLPDYLVTGDYHYREPSFEAACSLLGMAPKQRPTAIFCSGDLIAMATIQAANEMGLNVPRDVSVIGFANMLSSEFASPPLTTVDQPFRDMGKAAARLLLNVIEEKNRDETTAWH